MNDPGHGPVLRKNDEDAPSQGPSLFVLYGLIVVALLAAIGFALLIVLPFYNRR